MNTEEFKRDVDRADLEQLLKFWNTFSSVNQCAMNKISLLLFSSTRSMVLSFASKNPSAIHGDGVTVMIWILNRARYSKRKLFLVYAKLILKISNLRFDMHSLIKHAVWRFGLNYFHSACGLTVWSKIFQTRLPIPYAEIYAEGYGGWCDFVGAAHGIWMQKLISFLGVQSASVSAWQNLCC